MKSQPVYQTITIHILPNISRSKDGQTIKFCQLIEYNNINIFLQKSCRKWSRAGRLVPDLFLFFQKAFYEVNASGLQLSLIIYFDILGIQSWRYWYNKNKLYKTLDYWLIQRYAQFSFFRKEPGNSFFTTICEWFFKENVSHVISY